MKDLEHFVKLGKKDFGLEGAELLRWATEQLDKAITVREAEREHEKNLKKPKLQRVKPKGNMNLN